MKLKPDGLIFYLRESCPNPSMAGELVPVPTLASVTCPRCHKHHFNILSVGLLRSPEGWEQCPHLRTFLHPLWLKR